MSLHAIIFSHFHVIGIIQPSSVLIPRSHFFNVFLVPKQILVQMFPFKKLIRGKWTIDFFINRFQIPTHMLKMFRSTTQQNQPMTNPHNRTSIPTFFIGGFFDKQHSRRSMPLTSLFGTSTSTLSEVVDKVSNIKTLLFPRFQQGSAFQLSMAVHLNELFSRFGHTGNVLMKVGILTAHVRKMLVTVQGRKHPITVLSKSPLIGGISLDLVDLIFG